MSRVRTFIAIEIPKHVRSKSLAVIGTLSRNSDAYRWVQGENLHVTMKFLGDVEDRDTYQVCQAVSSAVAEMKNFSVTCAGLGAFPKIENPRTIWLGVNDPEDRMEDLFARIEKNLAEIGFSKEPRKYHPHLTLGRLRQGRFDLVPMANEIKQRSEIHIGEVPVKEVVVFSSELTSDGPVYTIMGRAPLR